MKQRFVILKINMFSRRIRARHSTSHFRMVLKTHRTGNITRIKYLIKKKGTNKFGSKFFKRNYSREGTIIHPHFPTIFRPWIEVLTPRNSNPPSLRLLKLSRENWFSHITYCSFAVFLPSRPLHILNLSSYHWDHTLLDKVETTPHHAPKRIIWKHTSPPLWYPQPRKLTPLKFAEIPPIKTTNDLCYPKLRNRTIPFPKVVERLRNSLGCS